jgi:hypothetical protein
MAVYDTAACLKDQSKGGNLQQRFLLPVALPRDVSDPNSALRNKWAFASLPVPLSSSGDAKDKVLAVNHATNAIKSSPVVGVQWWVQSVILPLLPAFLVRQTAYDLFARHSLVFSNLPGPTENVAFGPEADLGKCCAVLCCAVLCCAVLCCAVLCCAVLCCAVLLHHSN